MEPNFHDSEYLIVDQLSYRIREPKRGDVIIFRYPQDPSQFFIKRIIGLPGEAVRVADGRVRITDTVNAAIVQLDESPYLSSDVRTGGQTNIQLHEKEYFVLGDNREASSDSRSWGAVPKGAIMGRAWIRAWPLSRVNIFNGIAPLLLAVP